MGFGDVDTSSYLDRLFIHKDYQGMGVATAICSVLESYIRGKIITIHASITSKPFFNSEDIKLWKNRRLFVKELPLLIM
ncbi:GNAT family N-acetyltransferase [uncultured Ruminococcus sp.]|uniref:GNAT family N-acetyltransferase n=1 Tax=uncultured Ruminococcus sp. TaxID=165186 RepID=UPI0034236188